MRDINGRILRDDNTLLDLIAPFPAGYYTQQCMCTRQKYDRWTTQNVQLACNADLSHANLSHANLSHANLSHANLGGCDLCNSDLAAQCQPYITRYMGIPYDAERERRGYRRTRYSGNCPHCGAPVDAYAEKCAYCDCYYD